MDTGAEVLFKQLLKDLRPLFKENGFRSASQNFTLESTECWIVINFQKSRWSNVDEKTFYINVSATAKRLLTFNGQSSMKAPAFYVCEWRWRAEQLGPDKNVKHWTIKDEASKNEIRQYLQYLFSNFVIPFASEVSTELSLIERADGLAYYPHIKALSVLFAARGNNEGLRRTIAQLIDRFGQGVVADGVREHIEKLHSAFPTQMGDLGI